MNMPLYITDMRNGFDIPRFTNMCVILALESLLTKYFSQGMEKKL